MRIESILSESKKYWFYRGLNKFVVLMFEKDQIGDLRFWLPHFHVFITVISHIHALPV